MKKDRKEKLEALAYRLERAAQKHYCGDLWARMVRSAEEAERGHRAFGRRLNQGMRGRASVALAATYFAVKCTAEGFAASKPKRWEDADMREDFLLGRIIAEKLKKSGFSLAPEERAFADSLDYVTDIAGTE